MARPKRRDGERSEDSRRAVLSGVLRSGDPIGVTYSMKRKDDIMSEGSAPASLQVGACPAMAEDDWRVSDRWNSSATPAESARFSAVRRPISLIR